MTHSEAVVDIGQRLWGANWSDRMSEFASINPRTLTRIHAAVRDGHEYPAARGVLSALHERLTAMLADLEAARRA